MVDRPIYGALVGTIVGDAVGLPYEALSRRRGVRLLGPADRHRFIFGRGMMSDDGEHACMTAQSLAEAGGDIDRFRRGLARRMRWWLLTIPAGVGGATLRATIKLWLGLGPRRSGVFSAGNGPAMRAAVLGATIDDPKKLREFVAASTRITHTDPKAFFGTLAVAFATRSAIARETGDQFIEQIASALDDQAAELLDLLRSANASAAAGESTTVFADRVGASRGVSGYIYQTVPVATHAWLTNRESFADAVTAAIHCGGDTDTVAAITGGIVGAAVGVIGIAPAWRERLLEFPRTSAWVERLASSVEESVALRRPVRPPRVGPTVLVRNLLFVLVVFLHLGSRALPPY